MRSFLLASSLVTLGLTGCGGNCGTLEIGGQSGFEIVIGDLDRAVPIEGKYKNKCPVRVTPADPPINASSGFVWQEEPGYWEEHVELWIDTDHKNRQIDSTFSPYFWPAMTAKWEDLTEGATLDLDSGLLSAVMMWERSSPSVDDHFLVDGEPARDIVIGWPVEHAELEILAVNTSPDVCETILGEVYIKARYAMSGGPIGDDTEPWFDMEGKDVFITADDSLYCRENPPEL